MPDSFKIVKLVLKSFKDNRKNISIKEHFTGSLGYFANTILITGTTSIHVSSLSCCI